MARQGMFGQIGPAGGSGLDAFGGQAGSAQSWLGAPPSGVANQQPSPSQTAPVAGIGLDDLLSYFGSAQGQQHFNDFMQSVFSRMQGQATPLSAPMSQWTDGGSPAYRWPSSGDGSWSGLAGIAGGGQTGPGSGPGTGAGTGVGSLGLGGPTA